MNDSTKLWLGTILFVVVATAGAQWEVDGPNAVLRVNGVSGSLASPLTHDVGVHSPDILRVEVTSGANPFMPLLLATSSVDPTGAAIMNVPGLGIVNIGAPGIPLPSAITLLGDGIGRSVNPLSDPLFVTDAGGSSTPRYVWTLALPPLCQFRFAFQAIVTDPTSIPFQLDLTEAVDTNVDEGFLQVLSHVASDSVAVPFGNGYVFEFHSVAYSEMWVGRYGLVTFGGPTTIIDAGFTIDTRDFVSSEPAIAVWMSDWSPQEFSANDGVVVERSANRVHVGWGDPRGIQSGVPGIAHTTSFDFNDFSLDLVLTPPAGPACGTLAPDPGKFTIAIGNVSPNSTNRQGNGVIGHTPGLAALAPAVDMDLHVPQTTGPGIAAIEEHAPRFTNRTLVGYDGQGRPRHYSDMASWSGQSVTFQPVAAPLAGAAGYTSTAAGTSAPAFVAVIPATLDIQGNETITLVGKFHGFNDALGSGGSVAIVDTIGSSLPLTVLGIIGGGSSPLIPGLPGPQDPAFRSGEGLVATVPSMASMTPPLSIRVTYANGTVFALPVASFAGAPTDVYDIGDDEVVRHRFRGPPVRYYGQTYTECFISDNGQVAFGTPITDPTPSPLEFVAAFNGRPINPQIAVFWADLAPPPTSPTSPIVVNWDATTQEESVAWTNFQYFQITSSCGPFSLTFAPLDTLRFDHSAIIPASPLFGGLDGALTGVSDQGSGPDISNFLPGQSFLNTTFLTMYRFANSIAFGGGFSNFNTNGIWSVTDLNADGTWIVY